MKNYVLKLIIVICATLASFSAFACGDCYYRDDLGFCQPYDKCIVPVVIDTAKEQTQKVINLAEALSKGDTKLINQATGDLLLSSTGCLGCKQVAEKILPELTPEQINGIVGRGFFVFVATDDPVLVTLDTINNIAHEQRIRTKIPPETIISSRTSVPKIRKPKSFTAIAECIMKDSASGNIYAAWKEPATIYGTGGVKFKYPALDLLSGDSINVTAPKCADWDKPKQGQISLTSARFKFEAVSSLTGEPEVIKWFMYGPSIQ